MRKLYRDSKLLYSCYVAVLTLISSFAMGLSLGEAKNRNGVKGTAIKDWLVQLKQSFSFDATNDFLTLLLIGIALFFLARREYSVRCKRYSFGFAAGSAILLLVGRAFHTQNDLDMLFGSLFTLQKAFIVFIGYVILLYFFVNSCMEYMLPRLVASVALRSYRMKRIKITVGSTFLLLMVAWLPYIIVTYPCSFTADSRDEVAQFLGDREICKTDNTMNYPEGATTLLNNHHPITYTILVGAFAKVGMEMGAINITMFLFALLQTMIMALICSYTINYIKSLDIPVFFTVIVLGFFMFYPLIPIYAMTVTKDSLYGGCLLLLTMQLFKMVTEKEQFFSSIKERRILFGSALGLQLMRNNGLYIMLVLFAVLAVRYRKDFPTLKKIAISVGLPIFLYGIVVLKIVFSICHIPGGSPREMLSIPFQQVARYAAEWGEEGFQDGEIDTLDKILCFDGDLEVLKSRYDPVLSDPVKSKFNKNYTKDELKEFMVVWARLLKRHPGTFVTATLNNIYYYFSVDYGKPIVYVGAGSNGAVYGIKNPEVTQPARTVILRGLSALNKSSMFGWIFSVGTWTYIFLFAFCYWGYRKRSAYFVMALPVIINFMIALAGPVAYMRYAIQWIIVVPLFGAAVWLSAKEVKEIANEPVISKE